MTIRTFDPTTAPSVGATKKRELKILEAEFGDGYSQATHGGINYARKVLELTWEVLTPSEATLIDTFLADHGGITAFLYVAPGESTALKFTCREWSETFTRGGFRTMRATFRQSFNLS